MFSVVIVRLDRTTQYSEASVMASRGSGVVDPRLRACEEILSISGKS
jgi:hypothetical protein